MSYRGTRRAKRIVRGHPAAIGDVDGDHFDAVDAHVASEWW